MDEISKISLCFMKGDNKQALQLAGELLSSFDLDDDDELKELRELLQKGFASEVCQQFLELLIDTEFDFKLKWPGQGGILHVFLESWCRQSSVFFRLIELGADTSLCNREGRNILHYLAHRGISFYDKNPEQLSEEIVNGLEAIEEYIIPDHFGATPLHYAVLNGRNGMLEAILNKGVNADLCGTIPEAGFSHVIQFDQITPLLLACSIGNQTAVTILLNHGADASKTDSTGQTAAHYAIKEPCKHFCEAYYSSIPSKQAVQDRKCEILRLLPATDISDKDGNTPLLYAMLLHHYDDGGYAIVFLEKGSSLSVRNHWGLTPFMAAAKNRNKEALKKMLEYGIELNERDASGNTALHLVLSEGGDASLARYLIKKGADFLITNQDGNSPMDIAADKGMNDILELMFQKTEDYAGTI